MNFNLKVPNQLPIEFSSNYMCINQKDGSKVFKCFLTTFRFHNKKFNLNYELGFLTPL